MKRFAMILFVAAAVFLFSFACARADDADTGGGVLGELGDNGDLGSIPDYVPVGGLDEPKFTPSDDNAPPSAVAMPLLPPELTDKSFGAKQYGSGPKVRNKDNGIVVGQPKLFELRSLQMMIDNVKASLAQTSYPNASQLFAMTGRVQGVSSAASSQATQVTSPPPGTKPSANPSIPESAHLPSSDFDARGGLSLAPTDVLAEQTSLWYQLVNLQMLMDGALSDRLIPSDANGEATVFGSSVKFSPRAQAIVGFQISVDSRQEYRNAVAEAIITIDNKDYHFGISGYGDEPSLMMLLPRNKTYNTVSISRNSKSFGLGAIVNVLSMGYASEKRGETFYIGKDNDTVALERIPLLPIYGTAVSPSESGIRYRGVSFGWQFRPVFTRESVEPGVRQVFAMISLPASVRQAKWEGRVHVTTYWRKFDRGSGAVGKPIPGTTNEWDLDTIVVPIGSGIEEALEPSVVKAQWEDAGGGKVGVTLEGSNFSLGTSIMCGDLTLDESGLASLSSSRIRFIAPASSIARGGVTVMGRYGMANLRSCMTNNDDPYAGIQVSAPKLTQQDDQTTSVELTLSNVQYPARLVAGRCPVVQMGVDLFGVGDKAFTSITSNEDRKTITIRFCAPTQTLAKAGEMVVRDLLGPAAIPVSYAAEENCIAKTAVVLATGDPVCVAVIGSGFRDDVSIQIGGLEISDRKLNTSDGQATVITFNVDRQTAMTARYVMVKQGKQAPMLIPFSMPGTEREQAPRE